MLEPCPFCGGEAETMGSDYFAIYAAACKDKDCIGFYCRDMNFKTIDEAVEAWNRRANEG